MASIATSRTAELALTRVCEQRSPGSPQKARDPGTRICWPDSHGVASRSGLRAGAARRASKALGTRSVTGSGRGAVSMAAIWSPACRMSRLGEQAGLEVAAPTAPRQRPRDHRRAVVAVGPAGHAARQQPHPPLTRPAPARTRPRVLGPGRARAPPARAALAPRRARRDLQPAPRRAGRVQNACPAVWDTHPGLARRALAAPVTLAEACSMASNGPGTSSRAGVSRG
jgi:hypothetical protein